MCNKEQGYYQGYHNSEPIHHGRELVLQPSFQYPANLRWIPDMKLVLATEDTPDTEDKQDADDAQAKQPDQQVEQGMCLWTDGSCIPNPGFGGWGLHGYLYSLEVPKKGSGNPDHILTADGYVTKIEVGQLKALGRDNEVMPVTPVHYVDGFGSYEIDMARGVMVSNNIAELDAAYYGLTHAEQFAVKRISIYTDSEYLRKGMESWVNSWKKHGWRRSDGSEITNLRYWRKLSDLTDALRAKGITVSFDWVKSHSDILGNVKADRLADIGKNHSLAGIVKNELNVSAPDGYWGYDANKHPFISHQNLYFNTRRSHLTPGEYYLGNHGKEDDEHGMRSADGAYAVVRLKEPDSVIEAIIDHQADLADNTDNLLKLLVGNVFNATVHKELSSYGHLATSRANPNLLNLIGAGDEPLTSQFKPAKLAYRAVENIAFLGQKLEQYLADSVELAITDLTPILYETVVKTGKKESTTLTVLKDAYHVGFAALDVQANYKPDAATGELGQEALRLTLGIDILDRNGLRRLEKLNPKVSLITWMESEVAFRHATVIEVDGGVGIWAGMYSNIRVISGKTSTPSA